MIQLIDHTFNYLRFALLGIATAFVILGPAALGATPTQTTGLNIYVPPDAYYGNSSSLACDITIANPMAVYTMSSTGFWDCVLDDSANCGFWTNAACVAASFIIVTAVYIVFSAALVKALAQKLVQNFVKSVAIRLAALLAKFPMTSITIFGVTYNIPWATLASLLLNGAYAKKVLDFILLDDYSKATRICKCLVC